jgi:hypothetical protein
LERDAELPDHQDVERGPEGGGHLIGDGYATARKAQDRDVQTSDVGRPGELGQATTGVHPIAKPQ